MKITEIQLYAGADFEGNEDRSFFSADIIIDNKWVLQRGTDGVYDVPSSAQAYRYSEEAQDEAHEKYAQICDANGTDNSALENLLEELKVREAVAEAVESGAAWF